MPDAPEQGRGRVPTPEIFPPHGVRRGAANRSNRALEDSRCGWPVVGGHPVIYALSLATGSNYARGMRGRWVNSRYFTALVVIAMAVSLAQSAWACATKRGPADPSHGAMISQGAAAPVGGSALRDLHRRFRSTGCMCPGMCTGVCGWMPVQAQASQPQMRPPLSGHSPESGAIPVIVAGLGMPRAQGPPLIAPVLPAAHVYLATRRLRI